MTYVSSKKVELSSDVITLWDPLMAHVGHSTHSPSDHCMKKATVIFIKMLEFVTSTYSGLDLSTQ